MWKRYCDLCGKEINYGESEVRKIKKLQHSWYESWWVKIDTHKVCWEKLCNELFKESKVKNKFLDEILGEENE